MSKNFDLSKIDKEKKLTTYIDIKENNGKFRAVITEVIDKVRQPARVGFLDLIGQGDNAFMTVRAPLREVDANGDYLTRARTKDGKFLDEKGAEVESEDKAAREFVYTTQKNDATKLVYGQVATINVMNTKSDKTPTAFTLMSVKLFSDQEALEAERLSFKLGKLDKEQDADDYAKVKKELNELRRSQGRYENFFLGKGADALREMGFTVRERPVEDTPQP